MILIDESKWAAIQQELAGLRALRAAAGTPRLVFEFTIQQDPGDGDQFQAQVRVEFDELLVIWLGPAHARCVARAMVGSEFKRIIHEREYARPAGV